MRLMKVLGLATALALAAVGANAEEKTEVKFVGSLAWLGHLPVMVAIDEGFFAEKGIDMKYEVVVGSSDRLMAVTSGAADFSNLGRTALLSQLSRGNDNFVWFGSMDQAPGAEGCYAKPGIDSMAAVKGKRVAANTSAEFTMDLLLKDNGLTKSDIQFFDLPASEMALALQKDDVDVVCVWEPYLTKAAEAVPGGKIIGRDNDTESFKRTGTVASADVLVLSKSLVKKKPQVATGISEALFKAVDFIAAKPDRAAEIYQRYSKLDLNEIKAGMKVFQYVGRDKFAASLKGQELQLNEFAQWLSVSKKIHEIPDVKAAMDTSFLKLN